MKLQNHIFLNKAAAWFMVMRLQFYPMTWIAYSLGSLIALSESKVLDGRIYWTGYALVFLIEFITILLNEYFDFETDRLNENYSMFTGGSRILVKGELRFSEIKIALAAASTLVVALLCYFISIAGINIPALGLLAVNVLLGVGYTTPPVKFCYIGFGELVVCLTHSPLVILSGFVFQGGSLSSPLTWIYSIPLFFATFSAIILAGIPDRISDTAVSKRTIAVILGPRKAVQLSLFSTFIAAVSGLLFLYFKLISGLAGVFFLLIVPHTILLWSALYKLIEENYYDRQINKIMQLALSYIIWFGIIPLIYYLGKYK